MSGGESLLQNDLSHPLFELDDTVQNHYCLQNWIFSELQKFYGAWGWRKWARAVGTYHAALPERAFGILVPKFPADGSSACAQTFPAAGLGLGQIQIESRTFAPANDARGLVPVAVGEPWILPGMI